MCISTKMYHYVWVTLWLSIFYYFRFTCISEAFLRSSNCFFFYSSGGHELGLQKRQLQEEIASLSLLHDSGCAAAACETHTDTHDTSWASVRWDLPVNVHALLIRRGRFLTPPPPKHHHIADAYGSPRRRLASMKKRGVSLQKGSTSTTRVILTVVYLKRFHLSAASSCRIFQHISISFLCILVFFCFVLF